MLDRVTIVTKTSVLCIALSAAFTWWFWQPEPTEPVTPVPNTDWAWSTNNVWTGGGVFTTVMPDGRIYYNGDVTCEDTLRRVAGLKQHADGSWFSP